MVGVDHLNNIEQVLIETLRTGTFNTIDGGSETTTTAWSDGDVTVFGQYPTTDQVSYPCIITEMVANGIETQFMNQRLTSGSSESIGELYGVGFNLYLMVDRDSSLTPVSAPYRQRRLLNYLMLNGANILTDCDFIAASPATEVVERHFSGFKEIGYNASLETWVAVAALVIVFKNTR
jgi:hypothetical protein